MRRSSLETEMYPLLLALVFFPMYRKYYIQCIFVYKNQARTSYFLGRCTSFLLFFIIIIFLILLSYFSISSHAVSACKHRHRTQNHRENSHKKAHEMFECTQICTGFSQFFAGRALMFVFRFRLTVLLK